MSKPKKESAFMKPIHISEALQAIVGKGPMPRTEVVKKIWEYIKAHKLQDPDNKRMIIPDAQLARALGSSQPIDMFKMTSAISKHIHESEPAEARS